MSATRYTMLVASLPPTGPLFPARITPLSRIKLESRLRLLDPEDAALLRRIEDVLRWEHQPMERTDREIVAGARQLIDDLGDPTLRAVVESRLTMRTIMAALRRRARGESAPTGDAEWGVGALAPTIRRRWGEPAFGLGGVLGWVPRAEAMLAHGDVPGLEKLLLSEVWEQLGRARWGHEFDFAAVVIYVLRWNVIDRWIRYDAERAAQRFERMVAEGLGSHADLFG